MGDYPAIRVVNGRRSSSRGSAGWPSCSTSATEPEGAEYDTVIVGAGPAASQPPYTGHEGLSTIASNGRRRAARRAPASRIENYLGFPSGVSGDELASRALQRHGGSAQRSSSPDEMCGSMRRAPRPPRRRRRPARADDHPRLRRLVRRLRVDGSSASPGRHLVGAGGAGGEHARLYVQHRRRREIGRAGGDVLRGADGA